jgi:D-glycero-alpha-D-manno-heptose 1-phosphate guanylyltransferase
MREAIVLAGGFGTRLRQVVPDWPKPMAPIAGRPFLEILLKSLAQKGFTRAILSLGYMADKISNHFGNKFAGMQLTYVVENQPLGTGGAIRLAMTKCMQDHVFVLSGDTFLDLEAVAIEEHWLARHNPIIVARQEPDTARYGRLLVQDGLITGFTEKGVPGPGLINGGCYLFDRKQLDSFPLKQPFSLEADILTNAVLEVPIDVFVTNGHFIDIGVPEDYQRAQIEFADY